MKKNKKHLIHIKIAKKSHESNDRIKFFIT